MHMNYYQSIDKIKGLVLDIDGVLTDNRILITEAGEFLRSMNVRDGYAIKRAQQLGLKIGVISGGRSIGTKKRMDILQVQDVYLGVEDKLPVLKELLQLWNLKESEIAYMGDDLLDIQCIEYVGLGTCPKDAVKEVHGVSDFISEFNGGEGCVRDIIEKILQAQGKW
ncbi:MAG: HAD-IIIA family hydrolase [Saprospiraceae bacterium]|nr:HAD-IIIA family hydrolase [Saprospiraceae bacterium]MBK7468555.1 HAD-IIIA family hydrolase [Saprospiraceae bacterium]MBK9993099.1 HAD-IIIA family hydrolase [Saprospiraceae bacterium]